jgi:hypothetical protein
MIRKRPRAPGCSREAVAQSKVDPDSNAGRTSLEARRHPQASLYRARCRVSANPADSVSRRAAQ